MFHQNYIQSYCLVPICIRKAEDTWRFVNTRATDCEIFRWDSNSPIYIRKFVRLYEILGGENINTSSINEDLSFEWATSQNSLISRLRVSGTLV